MTNIYDELYPPGRDIESRCARQSLRRVVSKGDQDELNNNSEDPGGYDLVNGVTVLRCLCPRRLMVSGNAATRPKHPRFREAFPWHRLRTDLCGRIYLPALGLYRLLGG